jgi:hypothetical protein
VTEIESVTIFVIIQKHHTFPEASTSSPAAEQPETTRQRAQTSDSKALFYITSKSTSAACVFKKGR